jgi:hypothetical protein
MQKNFKKWGKGKIFGLFSISLICIMIFSLTATSFAIENTSIKNVSDFKQYAMNNKVNVMLYDENGKIINEYHADGVRIDFSYDSVSKKIKEISNSKGVKEVYNENTDGTFDVGIYKDSKLITTEKKSNTQQNLQESSTTNEENNVTNMKNASLGQLSLSANTTSLTMTPNSLTQYEDYIINSRNMNSIAFSSYTSSPDRFVRNSSTNMTQTDIQNFFNSKGSELSYQIQVWIRAANGQVIDTGVRVIPAATIDQASKNWLINPKVIIATLQKEQSLVTGSYAYNSSNFYGAMGYGNCYGTDSGFDTQVDKGTHCFYTLWNAGYSKGQSAYPFLLKRGTFYDVNASLNNNQVITYNGVTYQNYIWVKDCGTYALYCYTPWTSTFSGGFDSGNYLFLTCMRTYWPGSGTNGTSTNYNGANWK